MTREKCIKNIRRYIFEENVQNFIFNNRMDREDFLTTTDEIYQYMQNTMYVTFVVFYTLFQKWRRSEDPSPNVKGIRVNSYLRVAKNLGDLFLKQPLNFDLVESILLDLQVDVYYQGFLTQNLHLDRYIKPDKDNSFAAMGFAIRKSFVSTRAVTSGDQLESKLDDLISLLDLFPVLSKVNIEFQPLKETYGTLYLFANNEKIPFPYLNRIQIVIEDEEIIDTNFVLVQVGDAYYNLEEVMVQSDQNSGRSASLSFNNLGGNQGYLRMVVTDDSNFPFLQSDLVLLGDSALRQIIRDLQIRITKTAEEETVFRDIFSINYRYVRQLALSLADVFTKENKEAIRAQYYNKYPALFSEQESWDNIIAVLIVKESATSLMQFLFSIDQRSYEDLLYNLQTRFGAKLFDIQMIKEITCKEIENTYQRYLKHYFGVKKASMHPEIDLIIEKEKNHITSEVRACIIIDALSKLLNVNEDNGDPQSLKYPINIGSHIKMLDWLVQNEIGLERKKERLLSIVFTTLKTLYIFYQGFFQYCKIKNDFRKESMFKVFNQKEIAEFQKSANVAFRQQVRLEGDKFLESSDQSIGGVLRLLFDLNEECIFSKGRGTKNDILKEVLGRHCLFDSQELLPLFELVKLENIVSEVELNQRIEHIRFIYLYLQDGKNPDDLAGIYPYVGTYEYANETRDGYKVAHFSIAHRMTEKEMDFEVLSEFTYAINGKYYCLPNAMCSNQQLKIWIEPTIISYQNFIMVEESDENE